MNAIRSTRPLRASALLIAFLVPTFGGVRRVAAARRAEVRCGNVVAASAVKLSLGVLRCHARAALVGVKGKSFDEEPCENGPRARYDAVTARRAGCPACLDAVTVGDRTQSGADALAGAAIYCDPRSGRHIGDDTAFVPADRATARCENRVAANLGALLRAAFKCRRLAANAQLKARPFDVAACEQAAKTRYDAGTAGLEGCPACLDAPTLGTDMLADVAAMSGRIYCAP